MVRVKGSDQASGQGLGLRVKTWVSVRVEGLGRPKTQFGCLKLRFWLSATLQRRTFLLGPGFEKGLVKPKTQFRCLKMRFWLSEFRVRVGLRVRGFGLGLGLG